MARYRSRSRSLSRSYSPPRRRSRTPPRGRKRYDDDEPRDRYRDSRSYRDRRSPAPSGLLVRNLPLDARSDDLRIPFERFGPVKDVYLPKNYYTREPRGFGFVKYRYAEDAAEAKQQMNHKLIGGREIRIVFAEENRKTPQEMRTTTRVRDHGARDHYRSPVQSRSISQSPSPHDERDYRRSPSSRENGRSPRDERDGQDLRDERVYAPSRLRSPRGNRHSPLSRSRSYSPR
ncbi:serine/arginine-rich SC35-like splicing factor SCL28 isoform X2 [Rosa chinensis]|uniref:serine/arginine-rich SC35-like splicing factor SCL28 isoform X2 n=1 Tax=Rosa chinensis TaxID=74649 RepID=UPI001AD8A09B|nr:serine/arginine-rich SC35-like splicing factor SCL28 isoform X2 [Rosa chinensis]